MTLGTNMTSDQSKSQLVSALTQLTTEEKITWQLRTKNSLSTPVTNTSYYSDFFYETSFSEKIFILFKNSPKNIMQLGITLTNINTYEKYILVAINKQTGKEELNIQGKFLQSLYATVNKKIGDQETMISDIIKEAKKLLDS